MLFFASNENVSRTVFNISYMLASPNLPFRHLKGFSLSLLVLVEVKVSFILANAASVPLS